MADLGQVFTRQVVAHYMTSLFDLSKSATILDPCFGDGAFLRALQAQGFTNVFGCEIDKLLFNIHQYDFEKYNLFNQDFFTFGRSESFDGIIMNPPYIRQEKIDDLEHLDITKKILRKNKIFKDLPSTANMYMYFVMKSIDLLKENGQLIVIFPSSWLNALSGKKFKNALLKQSKFERIVYLHGNIFEKAALVDVVIIKVIKTTKIIDPIEEYMEVKNNTLIPKVKKTVDELKVFDYPFNKIATSQRGMTTGCNQMFINPEIRELISNNYLKRIISSPKSITGFSTKNAMTDRLLDCSGTNLPKELVSYLNKWKEKILHEQKPKTIFSKIQDGEEWYTVRPVPSKGIIFSYFVRNDMKFIMNDSDVLVRDNFYIIRPSINQLVMMALLNNYYTYYQLELCGKKYGAGLLKLQRYDLERLKFPVIEKISKKDISELKKLAQVLIDTGNTCLIDEITNIISKYSSVDFKTIKKKYKEIKMHRLEAS